MKEGPEGECKPTVPTSIIETINSSINPYGVLLQAQGSTLHEYSKIVVFDYQAIFLNLKQRREELALDSRFVDCPFKLPALLNIKDEHGVFSELM